LKSYLKHTISFIVALALLSSLFYYFNWKLVIKAFSLSSILLSLFLIFMLFFSNGLQIYYTTKKVYNKTISYSDISILPIVMHLFGYVVPFRGSYLFSIFFLRMKYNISIIEGGSVGLITQLISLSVSGFLLSIIAFSFEGSAVLYLFLFGLFLFLAFLYPILFIAITKRLVFKNKLLSKLSNIVHSISIELRKMTADKNYLSVLVLLNLINIGIQSVWFLAIGHYFELDLALQDYLLYAILLRLSVFIRILPGNLGVQELYAGMISYVLGIGFDTGIAIGLFFRVSAITLSVLIGIPALSYNFKHFNTISYSGLLNKIKGGE
jgi:hypothetical protein